MLCFEFWMASAEEEEKVPELLRRKLNQGRPISRIFLWVLLGVFNAVLWLLLLAFHWEISLRVREVRYWGHQLFPIQEQIVPLAVIYAACTLLTIASVGAILRDRSSLAARERIRALRTISRCCPRPRRWSMSPRRRPGGSPASTPRASGVPR